MNMQGNVINPRTEMFNLIIVDELEKNKMNQCVFIKYTNHSINIRYMFLNFL